MVVWFVIGVFHGLLSAPNDKGDDESQYPSKEKASDSKAIINNEESIEKDIVELVEEGS